MLENEDSVVTSLNELRKLKHERIARQTQSRAMVGAGRAAALAVDPMSDQLTPPPAMLSGPSASRPAPLSPASAAPSFNTGFGVGGGFAGAPAASYVAPISSPPIIQTKTSYAAAIGVAVLLIGGAGAGYMKLQQENQAMLAAKDASVKRIEEDRLMAAGVAAKSEAAVKNDLRQCEEKLKNALAMVPAAPAVTAPTPPVVEKKPERPAPRAASRSSRSSRSSARAARRARAEEDRGSKSKAVPMIARKKKLDNDPLAGLGKL
jgi:hypothetical protein